MKMQATTNKPTTVWNKWLRCEVGNKFGDMSQFVSQINIYDYLSPQGDVKILMIAWKMKCVTVVHQHGQKICNLFAYAIKTLWNALPPNIHHSDSLHAFEYQLQATATKKGYNIWLQLPMLPAQLSSMHEYFEKYYISAMNCLRFLLLDLKTDNCQKVSVVNLAWMACTSIMC